MDARPMRPRRRALSESSPALRGLGIELAFSQESESNSSSPLQSHPKQPSPPELKSHFSDYSSIAPSFCTMRSTKGMKGLLDAELGGTMVELDPTGSGFKTGQKIGPGVIAGTPRSRSMTVSGTTGLHRSGTLFSQDASQSRKSAELKTLLGSSSRRLPSKAVVPPTSEAPTRHRKSLSTNDLGEASPIVSLEKAKSKARVEVDIELEGETIVEGGYLRGKMEVHIRKASKNESPIWIGGGKMRVVGFEGLPNSDTRYTFYQFAQSLSSITSASGQLFASGPDEEGFCRAREGTHVLPFAMKIPVGGPGCTAKGVLQTRSGAIVRYIAMGSIKIKDPGSPVRSIAHFYRHVEIYPFLGQAVLAPLPADQPLRTSAAQSLFMGGSGKLQLSISLHRRIWVAGQRCYVHVVVNNESSKKVKTLTFTLVRTTTLFQPRVELDALSAPSPAQADMDACETSTSKKEVAQCTLEMGQKGEKGFVTAKGFWTGVEGGVFVELSHFILVPPDALSIPRGRLIEVDYGIRVSASAGSLSSDVTVTLPLRIINFLSIDPPPTFPRNSPAPVPAPTTQLKTAVPSPQRQGRRRSVSMQNLKAHEAQLKDWEKEHGRPVHSTSQSTRNLASPARGALTMSTSTQSSPTRSPIRANTPQHSQTLPRPSILSSPERGRQLARDMFSRSGTFPVRSKTVAFADEDTKRSRSPPSVTMLPPLATVPAVMMSTSPQRMSPIRKQQVLMRRLEEDDLVVHTPVEMKLTASTAADDELSSGDDNDGGYTDDDDYGQDSLSRRPAASQPEKETNPLNVSSLLRASEKEGDMSHDGMWDGEQDRSMEADEMADRAMKLLDDEEYLLDTSVNLPPEEGASFSPPRPMENPSRGPMGRSQSATAFQGPRHHLQQPPVPKNLQARAAHANRPATSDGYTRNAIPRTTSRALPRPAGSMTIRSQSMDVNGFPFPMVPPLVVPDEARWSGVLTEAQVTKVSRAAAVVLPHHQPRHPALQRSQTQGGALGSVSNSNLRPMMARPATATGVVLPPPAPVRMGHRSTLSSSSVSTDSSLQTQTSATSSSRGVPMAVKSKIAQLEARNRALRAFSATPTTSEEGVPTMTTMRKSYSAFAMPGAGGGVMDRTSVSSAESVYSTPGVRRGGDEYEAFKSPMFRKAMAQAPGRWVSELKNK